jgi:hypothetical protein
MPKRLDHQEARAQLAKLPPETLHAITVRLPAALLLEVHQFAEREGRDLASALRELMKIGQEAADQPRRRESAADRKATKKWSKAVERALRNGRSPIEPYLVRDSSDADLDTLPNILAELDYRSIIQELKEKRDEDSPWIERVWRHMKDEAPSHLQVLMEALDRLEKRFQARKKLYTEGGEDGPNPIIHWLLSDAVMEQMKELSSADKDVEAVRQLISARYLVADYEQRPWEFVWDE